jgi:ribosomal protein S18 acetylase RimI-like enzyme
VLAGLDSVVKPFRLITFTCGALANFWVLGESMTTVAAPLKPATSAVMPSIYRIVPEDRERLKRLRLRALKDSPDCFLSVHAVERQYPDDRWTAEFERGDWYAGMSGHADVSLIGVTSEPGMPESERYIEYMWVARGFRRHGVGEYTLKEVLGILRASGVKVVYLWVLDGNVAAAELYRKVGFAFTGVVQPLAARPGRSEQQMMLALA